MKLKKILALQLYHVKLGVWGLHPEKFSLTELSRAPGHAPSQDVRDGKGQFLPFLPLNEIG